MKPQVTQDRSDPSLSRGGSASPPEGGVGFFRRKQLPGSGPLIRNRRGESVIRFLQSTRPTSFPVMSLVPLVTVVMVFAIPILGIVLAGYKEWLKFKSKHQALGASTREVEERIRSLQERMDRLEQERDALRDRVQNLETIVTSEAWIAGHEDAGDGPALDAAEIDALTLPDDQASSSESEADRTAEIARRLRGQ